MKIEETIPRNTLLFEIPIKINKLKFVITTTLKNIEFCCHFSAIKKVEPIKHNQSIEDDCIVSGWPINLNLNIIIRYIP